MKLWFHLVAFAFLLQTVTVGDTEETKEQTQRTCRLLYPERLSDAPKNAFLYDGQTSHRVSLPNMNFSQVLKLPSGQITLILTANEVTTPEEIPKNAARLQIAAEIDEFYILLSPAPDNPQLPVKMRLIDLSRKDLRSGETLWFNQTDHRIIADLGDHQIIVEPQQEKVAEAPIAQSGYYTAQFKYQNQARGDILRITEQQWWHDAKSKHLGFISNSKGRLPKIYFFRDFRP